MLKNPIIKNILSAIGVAGLGFILLNLAFMLDFFFQSAVIWCIKLFTSANPSMDWPWFPPAMYVAFVILIGLLSWFIFRSKLGVFYKATFMAVPLAAVFVTIGMFLYRWPIIVYSLGGLFFIGVLYYFYRTKQPWLYYYTLILIGLVMLIVGLLGVEI